MCPCRALTRIWVRGRRPGGGAGPLGRHRVPLAARAPRPPPTQRLGPQLQPPARRRAAPALAPRGGHLPDDVHERAQIRQQGAQPRRSAEAQKRGLATSALSLCALCSSLWPKRGSDSGVCLATSLRSAQVPVEPGAVRFSTGGFIEIRPVRWLKPEAERMSLPVRESPHTHLVLSSRSAIAAASFQRSGCAVRPCVCRWEATAASRSSRWSSRKLNRTCGQHTYPASSTGRPCRTVPSPQGLCCSPSAGEMLPPCADPRRPRCFAHSFVLSPHVHRASSEASRADLAPSSTPCSPATSQACETLWCALRSCS